MPAVETPHEQCREFALLQILFAVNPFFDGLLDCQYRRAVLKFSAQIVHDSLQVIVYTYGIRCQLEIISNQSALRFLLLACSFLFFTTIAVQVLQFDLNGFANYIFFVGPVIVVFIKGAETLELEQFMFLYIFRREHLSDILAFIVHHDKRVK